MWLDMKTSIVYAMVAIATLLAPAEVTAYDCLDLPNAYTVEDMNEIKRHCENERVLGSSIYPSATWILHSYLDKTNEYPSTKWLTLAQPNKELRQICVISLGGYGISKMFKFTSVSGHCGDSYPINHADIHNFIDIGTGKSDTNVAAAEHALVQDKKNINSSDHYVMLVPTSRLKSLFGDQLGSGEPVYPKNDSVDDKNKYEIRVFSQNNGAGGTEVCPAFLLNSTKRFKSCRSIVGPLVYNGSFYGMNEIKKDLRPYHHGCFTVVNFGDHLTNLDFLEQIVTNSDYVDRCIGKFANVIKAPTFCPNPRRYYASMDPDPEGEVRTAFIKSENNVKGKLEVKVEFPNDANITYDCVHECSTTINQQDNDDTWASPKGRYDFSCRYLNGTVTLTKTGWKGPKKNDTIVLEHIERIIGQLKINAEVGYNVLPSLEIVDGSAKEGPALELYFTDVTDDEPSFPMQLTKVTGKSEPTIVLHHAMPKDKIPHRLIDDLNRLVANSTLIEYKLIAGTSPNTFF